MPFLPVYGFLFPFVDQLSIFDALGVVRACDGTYVPSFLTCPLTLVESAMLVRDSAQPSPSTKPRTNSFIVLSLLLTVPGLYEGGRRKKRITQHKRSIYISNGMSLAREPVIELMSRSHRKIPIASMTSAESDKPFKVDEHRRERRTSRVILRVTQDSDDRRLHTKVFGDPWRGCKDGKRYDPGDGRLLRK